MQEQGIAKKQPAVFFIQRAAQAVKKRWRFRPRKGRVCAGNPRGVFRAVEIVRFSELFEVLKISLSLSKILFQQAETSPKARF